eukprot:TRINITY_DN9518_c0_g1_i1.p1 TRINITY_DN9518_c0_g1~~TRINITY_DN9518_c0_g1_i1.p1  ORF type:complete len:149 (+),score=23.82 TRINITY_DN9518_c0_g1_i1:15-461(+)
MMIAVLLTVMAMAVVSQPLANIGSSDVLKQESVGDVDMHWTATGPLVIRASFYQNQAILQGRLVPREIVEEIRTFFVQAGFDAKEIIHITTKDYGTEVQIPHRMLAYSHGVVDARICEVLFFHGFKVSHATSQEDHEVTWFIYNPRPT